ncbi:unnamed protein product [Polarella glacialis]|uniref:Uncharacterized protein n=1 Tax=Polarella glacialis TaxID=89957 RepID=A0A813I2R1_POLGL|nr:unnamed protein product [Polarella glacialis]
MGRLERSSCFTILCSRPSLLFECQTFCAPWHLERRTSLGYRAANFGMGQLQHPRALLLLFLLFLLFFLLLLLTLLLLLLLLFQHPRARLLASQWPSQYLGAGQAAA